MTMATTTNILYYIVFIIMLHLYIMQIVNVAQHCFYGKFKLPVTNTRRQVFMYRGADKSLARPGRKQATATEDFDVHISYLLS